MNSNIIVRKTLRCPSWCLQRPLMDILRSVMIFYDYRFFRSGLLKIILETFLKHQCPFFILCVLSWNERLHNRLGNFEAVSSPGKPSTKVNALSLASYQVPKPPLWRHLEGVWDWIVFAFPESEIQISESATRTNSLHGQRRENLKYPPETR